ncbi:MAG: hypothetical protein L0Z62_47835, partial [Gemmataceae bacterium]|nr:hypothetical protein [Gemmataceae bacterium]
VIWTKPDDWELDAKDPKKGLYGARRGLVLAVHSYENSRGRLPPNSITLSSQKIIVGQLVLGSEDVRATVVLPLLPYFENNLAILKCPADPSQLTSEDVTSYLCNRNIFGAGGSGNLRMQQLRAGTSNLIAFGPRYMDCNGRLSTWRVRGTFSVPEPTADYAAAAITTPTQFAVPTTDCVRTGFSPGGKALWACQSDGRVQALSLPELGPTKAWSIPDKSLQLRAAAFSQDASRLAVGDSSGSVRLYSADGKPLNQKMRGAVAPLTVLAWSPNGQILAVGAKDGSVVLWDVENDLIVRRMFSFEIEVSSLVFHPWGRWLLGGSRGNFLKVWDVSSGEQVLTGPGGAPQGVSRDGRTVALGAGGSLGFCELILPAAIQSLSGHQGSAERIAWSRDNRHLASIDSSYRVCVWDRVRPVPIDGFREAPKEGFFVTNAAVAVNDDGGLVAFASGGQKAKVIIRDVKQRKTIGEWPLPGGFERMVCTGKDRFLLVREESAGEKGGGAVQSVAYELSGGKAPRKLGVVRTAAAGDRGGFHDSRLTPDGRYYWWSGPRMPEKNHRVEIMDLKTGKLVQRLPGKPGHGGAVVLSPDGRNLWVNEGGGILHRYDVKAPTRPERVDATPDAVAPGRWQVFQPYTGPGEIPTLRLRKWSEKGEWLRFASDGRSAPRAPVFSLDGRYLAWGSTGGVVTVADLGALQEAVSDFEKELQRQR